MAKPKVKEVIVVEGRYDKNTLSQVVDAVIVELGGFAVFNDKEKQAFLRKLAKEQGIILFTDPDGAGFVIRNRVKGNIPEGRVLQAYVPDIYGKEKRKRKGGKEGKLGVEGMKPEILLDALRRAGATIDEESTVKGKSITKADLYDLGLIGPDSVEKRKALCKRLELPEHLSANALVEVLNLLMSREELEKVGSLCKKYGVTVISDEIHCDITEPGKQYVPFASINDDCRDNSITLISPTKAFNIAGLQSAAISVPSPRLRHKVWRGINTDECAEPNVFAVTAAIAALTDGGEWLDSLNEYLSESKKTVYRFLEENLPQVKALHSDATYLMWLDVSAVTDNSKELARFIREKT